MQHAFRVGRRYRDTGSYRDPDDQFLRWIRGSLNRGIKNTGGIRDLGAERSETPAALVLVSNDSGISQHEDPWEDTLAVNAGYVSYWGDAKAEKSYDESTQNLKIKAAFDDAAAGRREDVPPRPHLPETRVGRRRVLRALRPRPPRSPRVPGR